MKRVRCRTGEVFDEYSKYLQSRHWKDVKRRYYNRYGYFCKRCNHKRDLQLHHRHYRNIGNEQLGDLESLCRRCHRIEHGLMNKRGVSKSEIRNKRSKKKWSWKVKLLLWCLFAWWIVSMWYYDGK